jgi:hypothetical protein
MLLYVVVPNVYVIVLSLCGVRITVVSKYLYSSVWKILEMCVRRRVGTRRRRSWDATVRESL